ncbi:MAG: GspH/FimT family pseudopilin [Methylibium sp.]|uniref:GspH/FimT family pseudopilin n=1 Tax=Methylibium sp. TaxID=2067992 RepID=UPI00183993E1|nr:GspH/FimT family pseudopilin [Methylibium sp.]MBA3598223.1 GspH/FimT family pseudopilin [Methylibium sp.]
MLSRGACRHRGFTVLELMVVTTVIAILLMVAVPGMQSWLMNGRVRTTAEALQNGLRLAQAEAVRQSRQVVFMLTDDAPSDTSAVNDNGSNWAIVTVPLLGGDTAQFVRGGALADVASGVEITGSTGAESICFNSLGSLAVNASPGPTGAVCTVDAAAPTVTYDIEMTGADRPLRVLVSIGGRVRMCDPAKALATNPDGCPPT